MKKILLITSATIGLGCFFCASVLMAFVFDFDFINPHERYELDPQHDSLSFDQWKALDDQRMENFKDYLLDGCADSLVFPPWKTDILDQPDNTASICHHHNEQGDN